MRMIPSSVDIDTVPTRQVENTFASVGRPLKLYCAGRHFPGHGSLVLTRLDRIAAGRGLGADPRTGLRLRRSYLRR
jgi:hypothetical protein